MLMKSPQDSDGSSETPYQVDKKTPGPGSCVDHRNEGYKQKSKGLLHGDGAAAVGGRAPEVQVAEGKRPLRRRAFKGTLCPRDPPSARRTTGHKQAQMWSVSWGRLLIR